MDGLMPRAPWMAQERPVQGTPFSATRHQTLCKRLPLASCHFYGKVSWAGDRLPLLVEDTLPLRPLSINRRVSPSESKSVPRKRLLCYPCLSVRTFRREVLSVACVAVACVLVACEGGLEGGSGGIGAWGAPEHKASPQRTQSIRSPISPAGVSARGATSTRPPLRGRVFRSGGREAGNEEDPQPM